MKKLFILFPLLLVFSLAALTACNLSEARTPTTPADVLGGTHTAAVQSVQATQTALVLIATELANQQNQGGGQASPTAPPVITLVPVDTAVPTLAPVIFTQTPAPSATSVPPTAAPTIAPTSAAACTNIAKFTGENWTDNTKILIGQYFSKRWTLQNAGTCTWTKDYTLTSLAGATMGIRSGVVSAWRMPKEVKPGESVDVVLEMYAPFTAGTYEASFRLMAPGGAVFGVGGTGQVPIYVRLAAVDVTIPQKESDLIATTLALGDPTWNSNFETETSKWSLSLANTTKATFELKDKQLLMSTLQKPVMRWMIGSSTHAYNQFVQATFTTGAACSGKDGYGMALRAEDIGGGVYNRAYVFQFTCDGTFRIHYMNGSEKVEIVTYTASPHIKTGASQINRMGVLILGGKIALYANGEKVTEVKNQIPADNTGIYGLMIAAVDTEKLQVYVDDFKLWVLDKWLK